MLHPSFDKYAHIWKNNAVDVTLGKTTTKENPSICGALSKHPCLESLS